ncbi:hypothetical protein [Psychromicrobium xiongbiense]|uniref:hypothetical protein n=1 Tax=Psychromicrobium xiongbiense TaxID=3051184 RepID=UPI002557852C|nr:hypothetical protein [Psychromicrobium sp. YIM S02556]
MDLATAKRTTLAQENEIASAIPAAAVIERDQSETSGLLSCGEGNYLWYGHLYLTLAPGTDGSGYLPAIAEDWAGRPGWSTRMRTTPDGLAELVLAHGSGYNHSVVYNPQRGTLRIMSDSRSFPYPPGIEPGVSY